MDNLNVKKSMPESVIYAKKLAEEHGFQNSCIDEVGNLLQVLCASIKTGKIAEIGTGYGVGASWIISTLNPDVQFMTIDNDEEKIKVTRGWLNNINSKIIHGDWREILRNKPFRFIFADGGKAKEQGAQQLFDSLEVGGMIVMDDFTPVELWPDQWKGNPDPVREFWLNHPKMSCVEIRVTPRHAVIIGTKLSH